MYWSSVHLLFTEVPELWEWRLRLQCCFTSTETVPTIRDGGPRSSILFHTAPVFWSVTDSRFISSDCEAAGVLQLYAWPYTPVWACVSFVDHGVLQKSQSFCLFYTRRLREHTIICSFTRFCILILEFSLISPTNFHFLFFYLHIVCLCACT